MDLLEALMKAPSKRDGKVQKKPGKHAEKSASVVRMIQAGHHIWKATKDPASIPQALAAIQEAVPIFQVMAKSVCDTAKVATSFSSIATTLGTVGNLIIAYQGVQALNLIASNLKDINNTLQAQTALMSIEKFPQAVYDLVEEALHNFPDTDEVSNWFFVYHPDTIWTPGFHRLIMNRGLHRRFCGHSNQLDAAVVFMLAARDYSERATRHGNKLGKQHRRVKLHLLIPAYQAVVIKDPIRFPEALGDFTIHGKVHNSRPLVWINVPEDQQSHLDGVGRWQAPQKHWLETMFIPIEVLKARELGRSTNSE
ncbi:hypothetical protein JX265_000725 [Neoarthrinium moseri]|uniref:Uncharacterized protein n=1 Tax=Neoarthrinium moseri TaxID=1658444 RepID=A0A9P9WWH7_9PEZI|nr:uncharacterized protein JN550_013593 [Neoarthrinium moseri]KAI1840357.1 hypothetical protein JX266_013450 [Neoarthrinium moseri]KAI1856923.1 hypothetical protein JN550_013593 [Neoarthrinium moseri]KAI1880485.1 hypothetical protein JX265_000725 [Neoarthrinium moseri]